MLTFTMLVTIWLGPHTYKFNVFTTQRFSTGSECLRAANELADYVQQRARVIKNGRIQVDRECFLPPMREA